MKRFAKKTRAYPKAITTFFLQIVICFLSVDLLQAVAQGQSRDDEDTAAKIRQINAAIQTGDPAALIIARRAAEELVQEELKNGNLERQGLANAYLGTVVLRQGAKELALKTFEKSRNQLKRSNTNRTDALVNVLMPLGNLLAERGDRSEAIMIYKEILPLFDKFPEPGFQLAVLQAITNNSVNINDSDGVIKYYEQAIAILEKIGDKRAVGYKWMELGNALQSTALKRKAYEAYKESQKIWIETNDPLNRARFLLRVSSDDFRYEIDKPHWELLREAFALLDSINDKTSVIQALVEASNVYSARNQYSIALQSLNEAYRVSEKMSDPRPRADLLLLRGNLYAALGDLTRALDEVRQAVKLAGSLESQVPQDRQRRAAAFRSLGNLYYTSGQLNEAIESLNQARTFYLGPNATPDEVITRSAILAERGFAKVTLGMRTRDELLKKEGIADITEAIDQTQTTSGHRPNYLVDLLGTAYLWTGDAESSIPYLLESLKGWAVQDNQARKSGTLEYLSAAFAALGEDNIAIAIGKLAVESRNNDRFETRQLDSEYQKGHLNFRQGSYRSLLDLLLKHKRTAEAFEIVMFLRDQEFLDFDDRGKKRVPLPPALTEQEARFKFDLQKLLRSHKFALTHPVPSNTEAALTLDEERKTDSKNVIDFLARSRIEFKKAPRQDPKPCLYEVLASKALSEILKRSGMDPDPSVEQNLGSCSGKLVIEEFQEGLSQISSQIKEEAVSIIYLSGNERHSVVLVTSKGINQVDIEVDRAIPDLIFQLRSVLTSPVFDPRPISNQLYRSIFEPIDKLLPKDTKTIIWSVEGVLRHIPVAVLYDGERYLAERFNNVNITRTKFDSASPNVKKVHSLAAFGASEEHTVNILGKRVSFDALPEVITELDKLSGLSAGGEAFKFADQRDKAFDEASTVRALKEGPSIVHFASHFSLRPGSLEESFLLLGDGSPFSLARMRGYGNLFENVELLTLSACDTGADSRDTMGFEVDSFAELAQRMGTRSVLASLWPVADKSTSLLMKSFYDSYLISGQSKAGSLRAAQIAMINGTGEEDGEENGKAASSGDGCPIDGFEVDGGPKRFNHKENAPYSHPYYWAPFVLYGDWR